MTPTNEAGHGLPKLPQTEEFALRAMATNYGEGHRWDSLDRDVCRRAADEIKILRERIVALSRGVPDGLSEVTRQLIERDQRGRQKYGATLDRADLSLNAWLQHMAEELMDAAGYALAAKRTARAAAGAQGEEGCGACGNGCKDRVGCELAEQSQPIPQPAAADGCVRERARELLADAQQRADGHGVNARLILDEGMALRCNVACEVALHAVSAALSSHRQAGDDLSKFRELAERWQANGHLYVSDCADDLIALVEKGAGNG